MISTGMLSTARSVMGFGLLTSLPIAGITLSRIQRHRLFIVIQCSLRELRILCPSPGATVPAPFRLMSPETSDSAEYWAMAQKSHLSHSCLVMAIGHSLPHYIPARARFWVG